MQRLLSLGRASRRCRWLCRHLPPGEHPQGCFSAVWQGRRSARPAWQAVAQPRARGQSSARSCWEGWGHRKGGRLERGSDQAGGTAGIFTTWPRCCWTLGAWLAPCLLPLVSLSLLVLFLQNLAIGAGAVGSLQLTYISKVRAGGQGCPVPSPYPAVLPGEVRSCPVPIPAACLGGVGGRGTALR